MKKIRYIQKDDKFLIVDKGGMILKELTKKEFYEPYKYKIMSEDCPTQDFSHKYNDRG